jgi:putative sterol carrier protein
MAVFEDAADVDAHIGEIFRQALADPELAPRFAESGVVLKLHYTEPACTMTADLANARVYFDEDAPTAPNVEMFMRADVAHRFWLGKVNIAAALAKGEMRAKGPIPKILKLVPLARTLFPRYAELCERVPVGSS